MKLSVFALIAGLCLVAVAVNGGVVKPEEYDDDLLAQEFADEIEIEAYGITNIFSGTYWALKKILQTVKGLNCLIKAVMNIKAAAEQFPLDVKACGVEVSKQLQNVLNSVSNVLSTCNDLINLNDNVCNNADLDDDANLATKLSNTCIVKVASKLMTLKGQLSKTISLIKKVPTVGPNANACVNTAMDDLTGVFTGFNSFVKTCSQLVSS